MGMRDGYGAAIASEIERALAEAAQYDRKVIVERAIVGKELECSVLGNDGPVASEPCEVIPSRDFYDYEDKYLLDKAQFHLPARIEPGQIAEVKRLAMECYKAVQCEGMARVDFLIELPSGRVYINEINTIPGFTSISMFPKMWMHGGISYAQLLDRLIGLALARDEAKKATRYTL